MRRRAAVAGTMLLASCTDPAPVEPTSDFEFTTKWFVIRGYDRQEDEICGGTVGWLDGYTDVLTEVLGISPTTIGAYHWYSEARWHELGICGPQASACVNVIDGEQTAFSRNIPHEHELNHVVFNYAHDSCVALLSEGLAEYMRGPWPSTGGSLDQSTIDDVLAVSFDGVTMTGSDYHRARHFASFLVYEFGLADVVALCAETPKGTTRSHFSDAALARLGMSLDELLSAYTDYPICDPYHDRGKLWECSREPVVELGLGDIHRFEIDASCAHPEAVGPRGDKYHFSYRVRVTTDGNYTWATVAQPPHFDLTGAELRIEQCASCGDGALGFMDKWTVDFIALPRWLSAGDYTLDLLLPLSFSGPVSVRFDG